MIQAPAIELGFEATTLRLVRDEPRFIPPGAKFPNSIAIEPTNEDKEDARRRGLPIRVSVWDRARTSVSQAVTFRRSVEPLRAYSLPVAGVVAVKNRFNLARLRVVEDPLEDLGEEPGADGHCGVEGLDREQGQPRSAWRDMLDELLQYCTELQHPALGRSL
jgi:hypothetical protein